MKEGTAALASNDINGHLFADKSTSALSNFKAIKKWHFECRLKHKRCNKTLSQCDSIDPQQTWLPTRCIQIRHVCGDCGCTKHSISFILRETAGEKGEYVILSHRWTEKTFAARTTQDNYNDRRTWAFTCTGPNSVTPLFYEAGQAAHWLGIEYIWIDSVCIIQDDPVDWARESAEMAQYYQYAWLTIVAAHTENRRSFRDVVPRALERVTRLPYRNREGEQDGYFYLQGSDLDALANDYLESFGQGDFISRG